MQLTARSETWPLARTFRISRGARTEAVVVVAEVSDGVTTGLGESVPYARYGETVERVIADIEAMRNDVENGLTRKALQQFMPAGAARNALDCALWDFEAKRSGKRHWDLAGLPAPSRIVTVETVSLDDVDVMRREAAKISHKPLLKMKLADEGALDRIRAVHEGAPNSRIIVDANEGMDLSTLLAIAPELKALNVAMLEQPFRVGEDAALNDISCDVPLCADESCHTTADLAGLKGRYDFVNIKLDKTGGLTGALELAEAATKAGLQLMTGCMVGTSLAMAPAMIIGAKSRIVDLDGPIWMAKDREHGLTFDNGVMGLPDRALWG